MPDPRPPDLATIFERARALRPDERGAYLDGACAGDGAVRAKIEALLGAHDRAGSFMGAPVTQGIGTSDAVSETAGAAIGPYRLLQELGEGGFGTVFLAEQSEPVRRRVALKIIKLGMDTRSVIARFEAERQALAIMDHPNIAKVLDAGATEAGRPYFVMELVAGDPITTYCDRNNLSIDDRLGLFEQVCGAVQHAHTKGIIHRDLKPSNVLVSTQDGRPWAKVIDFGIAKATNHRLTEKTLFTEHRAMIGTPEYMSPEQAEGSLDIDTRTDVYALGVLLYELLTGTTPFDARSLRSAAYAEIQRIIREVEPPKPSTRLSQNRESAASVAAHRRIEPGQLGVLLRGDLDWIVMRAMEKDRARRYDTASALAMDLKRHLAGEPVLAAPPSAPYRIQKFVRRHKGSVVAGTLVGAVLVLGVVGTTAGMIAAVRERNAKEAARAEEAKQRTAAEASERAALENAERARAEADRAAKAEQAERTRAAELEQVALFQSSMFTGLKLESMGQGLVRKVKEEVRAAMERRQEPPERIEDNLRTLDALLSGMNATNVALASVDENILTRAETAIRERFNDQPLVRARLFHTVALVYQTFGLYERVLTLRRDALEIHRTMLGEDDPETLLSMGKLGRAYCYLGRYPDAERVFLDSLGRQRRVLGNDHKETIVTLNDLGTALFQVGRLAEAERFLREALGLRRQTLGPDARPTLEGAGNLGQVLIQQGKLEEAEPFVREALDGYRRTLGDNDSGTIRAVGNMGLLLMTMRRLDEAEPLLRDSHERWSRTLGDNHPETIQVLNNLAGILRLRGRIPEAERAYRDVYAAYRRTRGPDDPRTLMAAAGVGRMLEEQGRFADAEAQFREAADGFRRLYGERGAEYLTVSLNLASVLRELGRLDAAEAIARSVNAAYEEKPPDEGWRIWQGKGLLGSILLAQAEGLAGADAGAAIAKLRESAPLLLDGHQRLIVPGNVGPGDGSGRQRLVSLYTLWDRLEPGAGHDAEAARWRAVKEDAPR